MTTEANLGAFESANENDAILAFLDRKADVWAAETDIAGMVARMSTDPKSREKLADFARQCFVEAGYRTFCDLRDEGWSRPASHARQPGAPVAWQHRYAFRGAAEMPWLDGRAPSLPPFDPEDECYSDFKVEERPLYTADHPAPPAPEPVAYQQFKDGKWVECSEFVAKGWGDKIDEGCRGLYTRPAPPAPVAVPEGMTADEAWQDLCEKDDRTSPAEYPDYSLITREELAGYMRQTAPSPASPEKGTERVREALRILRNALAFYSTGKHFYGDIIVDRGEHARAALASHPAEPEGETWFAADVRRASERQEQIDAAAPSTRAAALSALAEMDADEILATHPTAPKPAEVRETTARYLAGLFGEDVAPRHREWADELLGRILSPAPAAEEFRPTHRHVKRGLEYRVLGEAEAQVSAGGYNGLADNERKLREGDRLTVYQGADGKLWACFTDEFTDGRFIPLPSGEG
ncbi:hypothetical protein [Xanthobacter aminoxidans]|uniref:hypothetical protein n=1 Tax=Xanthobacter aminoxidans TaxID=186280 RepID=UPI002022EDD8|nr:hypothetical protein [Xanthobacter aminoxidans]MCL8382120.1 hypothetical protein [Xanthobacter aminoxidans]